MRAIAPCCYSLALLMSTGNGTAASEGPANNGSVESLGDYKLCFILLNQKVACAYFVLYLIARYFVPPQMADDVKICCVHANTLIQAFRQI